MRVSLRKIVDRVFDVGVMLKAFFGFFEVLAGILLAVSGKLLLNNFIIDLAQQEIAEDPNDLIANFLVNSAHALYYDARVFAVAYLAIHGVINVFLGISLLKNKIWAYPWAIGLFEAFIIYQIYKFFLTFSWTLFFLSVFDILLVLIIYLEWNRKKISGKIEIPVE